MKQIIALVKMLFFSLMMMVKIKFTMYQLQKDLQKKSQGYMPDLLVAKAAVVMVFLSIAGSMFMAWALFYFPGRYDAQKMLFFIGLHFVNVIVFSLIAFAEFTKSGNFISKQKKFA